MSEENKTPEQVEEVQAAATETPETATCSPVKEEVKKATKDIGMLLKQIRRLLSSRKR